MLSVGTGDLLLLAPAQGSPLAVTRLRLGNAGSWPRVQTPLGAGVAGGRGDHDNTAPSRSGGRSAPRSGSELLPLASGFRSAASATTAARVRRPRGPRGQRVVTGAGASICAPAGPPSRARRRAAPSRPCSHLLAGLPSGRQAWGGHGDRGRGQALHQRPQPTRPWPAGTTGHRPLGPVRKECGPVCTRANTPYINCTCSPQNTRQRHLRPRRAPRDNSRITAALAPRPAAEHLALPVVFAAMVSGSKRRHSIAFCFRHWFFHLQNIVILHH